MGEITPPYGAQAKIYMVQRAIIGIAACRDHTFDLYDVDSTPLGRCDIAFTSLVHRALGRSRYLRFFPCFLIAMYDTDDQLLIEGNYSVVLPLQRMVLRTREDEFLGRMDARHPRGDLSGYHELGLIGPSEEALGAIAGNPSGRHFEMRTGGQQVISSITADINEPPEALIQNIEGRYAELWEVNLFHQHLDEIARAAVVAMALAGPFMLRRVNDHYPL